MAPHFERVDEALSPGLTMLKWTSLNILAFVESVRSALSDVELLVDRANDILEFRIEGVYKQILSTPICELPENEPWTTDQLLSKARVHAPTHMYDRMHILLF